MDTHPGQSDAMQYPPPQTAPVGAPGAVSPNPPLSVQSNPTQQVSRVTKRVLPAPTAVDALFALFLLAMGFCFWNWRILFSESDRGVGATLFFCLILVGTVVYLNNKDITQTKYSWLLFALALVASLPFALFGAREIDFALLLFEACLCLFWVAVSCRTLIAEKLNALLVVDLFSQSIVVPFANFGQFFVRGTRGLSNNKTWMQVLIALAGLLIALPLIGTVIFLLMSSDESFSEAILKVMRLFDSRNLGEYIGDIVLAIPLACYVFGAVIGNVFKNHSGIFKRKHLEQSFVKMHALPRAALYSALFVLILVYLLYFVVMSKYHFSALQASLPADYSYSEYARQGFFELCWVAVINLCVLGITWIFAQRVQQERPVLLRVLTAVIAVLTCLLVVVAASKMWLYIQAYGLTPLRVYTSWFMILLLISFIIVLLWHIRPFNIARPLVVTVIALTLALSFTNVHVLIADYNVDIYLSGQTEEMDAEALAQLSDAAVPALDRLHQQAADSEVKQAAALALQQHEARHNTPSGEFKFWDHWYNANLTSLQVWSKS